MIGKDATPANWYRFTGCSCHFGSQPDLKPKQCSGVNMKVCFRPQVLDMFFGLFPCLWFGQSASTMCVIILWRHGICYQNYGPGQGLDTQDPGFGRAFHTFKLQVWPWKFIWIRSREYPKICMDLQIRTTFDFVLIHPPLNQNIHYKKICTLWNFYFKDLFFREI